MDDDELDMVYAEVLKKINERRFVALNTGTEDGITNYQFFMSIRT